MQRLSTQWLLAPVFALALLVAAPVQAEPESNGHGTATTIVQEAEHTAHEVAAELGHGADVAAGHDDHAAHGEHPERALVPGLADPTLWWEMAWSIVVFLIFFGVLSFVVWPKILKGLQAREEKQRSDLQKAEKAAADAAATLKQYEAQLAEARKEAQQMIEQSRSDAAKLAGELKVQAENEVAQLRQRVQNEIRTAKEQAIGEIYAEAAMLATQVAGKILQREINPEDQKTLVEQSLGELNRAGNV